MRKKETRKCCRLEVGARRASKLLVYDILFSYGNSFLRTKYGRGLFINSIYFVSHSNKKIVYHLFSPQVLLSICSLLTDCNPADPLVGSIATQFTQNREEHDRIAKLWTKRYAT